jgi:hypothetical protein
MPFSQLPTLLSVWLSDITAALDLALPMPPAAPRFPG